MIEMYIKSDKDLEIETDNFICSVKKGKRYKVEKHKEMLYIHSENDWVLEIGSMKDGKIEINRMFKTCTWEEKA